MQTSLVVQALASSQLVPLPTAAYWQPAVALQLSVVHGLASLHTSGLAPTHAPLLLQASVWVHRLPSVHDAPASVAEPTLLQAPVVVLQVSSVHGLLSLQFLLAV